MDGTGSNQFGRGFDTESGNYPTRISPASKSKEREASSSLADNVNKNDVEYVELEGLILDKNSFGPRHKNKKHDVEPSDDVTTVFIGSGSLWYRLNFWGDIGKEVDEQLSVSDTVSLNIRGIEDYARNIRDVHMMGGNETYWKSSEGAIQFKPEAGSYCQNPDTISPDEAVPLIVGDVISSTGSTARTGPDGEFVTNHVAVHSGGTKILCSLYNDHAKTNLNFGDTIGIFAGWSPEQPLEFVPSDIPSVEYSAEIAVRSYSGLCNLSDHNHINTN